MTIQGDNTIGDYVSIAAGTSTSPKIKNKQPSYNWP